MSDDTYEGWTNRETWAIQLHLSNNEGDYDQMRERAAEIVADHDNAVGDRTGAIATMADFIKDWTENVFDMVTGDSETYGRERAGKECRMFVSDVGSWWRADFYEIAEHWIDEAYESVAS